MLDTSARLLRLLSLLQAKRFWSGADLAERLEVTERTVRRDVDKLRSLGYPVQAAAGVAGGYQLGAGAHLPPLLLEDDEAMAVSIGLRTAAAGVVTGIEESALRALAKLEQVLPPRLRRKIADLHTAITPLHQKGPMIAADTLSTLASACRDHLCLQFMYGSVQGERELRSVEPHGLVHSGARWYLVAWDRLREDWRTFRVDRIAAEIVAGQAFLPRAIPGGDAATYVARTLPSRPYTYQARVVMHARYEQVAPLVPPLAAHVEPLGDEQCLIEAGANTLEPLALHIAALGFDFEVKQPPELIRHLRELSDRLARAARESQAAPDEAAP